MKKVLVDAAALRQVLQALNGPAHYIRELQVTRNPVICNDNPINVLVDDYNAACATAKPEDGMLLPDDTLRKLWRAAGGAFHGPLVETGTMPEENLLPFLRRLLIKEAKESFTGVIGSASSPDKQDTDTPGERT